MSRPVEAFSRKGSNGVIQVGSRYTDNLRGPNDFGPIADVYTDNGWLWITTDPYEGSVMLDAETLPLLIKALQRLESERRKADKATTPA